MRHHTTDPIRRAEDVANREAEEEFKRTDDSWAQVRTWRRVFEATSREFLLRDLALADQ